MPAHQNLSKADRREAAREQARQLREAHVQRERRNRNLLIGGVLLLIAAVAVALYIIISQGTEPVAAELEDMPRNVSVEDGGISLGNELVAGTSNDGAPVLDVYLDYTCGYCAQFEEINATDIEEAVSAGEATVVYHPVAILDGSEDEAGNRAFTDFPGRAAQAAAVVADGAPEAFNAFHQGLFELWASALDSGAAQQPTDEEIAEVAAAAGVPDDVVGTIDDGRFTEWVAATTEQFRRDGFTGTPTVLVDGERFDGWNQPGALLAELTGD